MFTSMRMQMQTMSRMMALSGGAQGEARRARALSAAPGLNRMLGWPAWRHWACGRHAPAGHPSKAPCPGVPGFWGEPFVALSAALPPSPAGVPGMPQMSDEEMMEAVMGGTGGSGARGAPAACLEALTRVCADMSACACALQAPARLLRARCGASATARRWRSWRSCRRRLRESGCL